MWSCSFDNININDTNKTPSEVKSNSERIIRCWCLVDPPSWCFFLLDVWTNYLGYLDKSSRKVKLVY